MESGETPENALAREILEELGVELVIEGPGTRYESRIGERAYVFLVFPARFSLAEGESVSLTVHDEWGFYSASELGGLNLAPLDGPALEDWINRKGLGRAPLRTGGEGRH